MNDSSLSSQPPPPPPPPQSTKEDFEFETSSSSSSSSSSSKPPPPSSPSTTTTTTTTTSTTKTTTMMMMERQDGRHDISTTTTPTTTSAIDGDNTTSSFGSRQGNQPEVRQLVPSSFDSFDSSSSATTPTTTTTLQDDGNGNGSDGPPPPPRPPALLPPPPSPPQQDEQALMVEQPLMVVQQKGMTKKRLPLQNKNRPGGGGGVPTIMVRNLPLVQFPPNTTTRPIESFHLRTVMACYGTTGTTSHHDIKGTDRLQVQDIQQILPDFVSLDESTNTIQLNIPWIQQGRYVTGTTYSCGLPDEDGSPNSTYSFNEYVYVLDGPDHFPVTDSLHILNKIICDFATFCILNQDRNIQMDYAHDKAQSWGSHVALICRHCARIYVRASTLKGGMIQIVVSDEPYQRGCTCSPGGLDGCPMVPIRPSSIQSGMATGAIPTAIADTSRTPLMINDFPHDITNTLVLQRLIPYYPEIVMDNTCDSTTIVKWLEDLRETYNLSHSKRWPRDFYTRWRKKESYPRITSTATLVGNYECLSGTSSSRPKLHRNLDQAMVEESRGAEEVNDPEAILAVLSTTGKHDVAAQTTVDEDETRASSQKGIEKAGHFTTAEAATSSEQEGNQRPVDGRNDDDDDDDDDPPSKMVRLEDGEDEEEDTTTASGKEEKGIACEKEEGGEENARDQVLQLKEVVSRLEKQLWDQQAANEALTSRVSEVELQLESERRAHLQKSEDLQAALSAVTTLEVELNALASAASPDNDLDTAVRQEEEEAAAARGQEDEENRRRRQNLMARRRKFEKVMTKSLKDAARDAYKDKDVESRSRTRSVGATYSVLRSGVVTMKPPAGKDPDRDIAAKFMDFLISKPCLSYMEQMIKKKLYPSPEDDETGFEAIRKIQGDRIELSFKKGNCDAALHLLNIFYKSNRIRMPGGDLSSLEYYRDKGPIGTVLKMIYNQFQNVPKRHLYIELAESSDELQVSLIISKEDAKAQTVHLDAEDGNSNSITNFNPGSGTLLYDVATDHEFKVSGVDSSVIVDRFQTVLETNLQNVSLSPSTLELMHESDEIKTSLEKKGDVVVVQICGPGKFQRTSEKNERWTTTLMSSTQLHAGPPSALPRIAGYCPHKNIGSNGQEYGGETQSSAVLIILYICLDIWTANEGPDGEPGIASRLWPAGDVDANLKIARRDILRVLWEVIKTDDLQNWSDNIQSNDRVATMMRTMENSKETNFSEEEVSGMIESWASCDDMFGW